MSGLPSSDPARGLTLSRLRALTAVAEAGSYAGAARRLGLSHSAVSQQVREVETAHGVQLFDRIDGGLRATALCLGLCEIGARMQEAEREALRLLGRRTASGDYQLRVGLGNSMPGLGIVGQLIAQHAGVSVTLESGSHQTVLAALMRRDVDVAVLPDVPADPRLRRETVMTQEVVAIIHDGHPLARAREVTLAGLVDQPLIFRSAGSSCQKVIDRALRLAGLAPAPRLIADSREAVYEAVALGIGIGFMWRYGSHRTDRVARVPVADLRSSVDEVVFAHKDDKNALVNLFFHAARHFRLNSTA